MNQLISQLKFFIYLFEFTSDSLCISIRSLEGQFFQPGGHDALCDI